MFASPSSPLLHVKEINNAAMSALLFIGEGDPGAAAMLFGTTAAIVRRLVALDESDVPLSQRKGYIETLTEASAPIFEVGVGASYLEQAAKGPIDGDLCSDNGIYANYLPQVRYMNRAVMRSLDRLTRDRAAAIAAMNVPQAIISALVEMSDQEVVRIEDHAARPLVRFRLTEAILDQLFNLDARTVIEPGLASWLLWVHTTPQELDSMPHADRGTSLRLTEKPKVGRPKDAPISQDMSEMARAIGKLGGTMKTARRLLGHRAGGGGLKGILDSAWGEGRPSEEGSVWYVTLPTKLATTAIVFIAMRLQRSGFQFCQAHLLAFTFYRDFLSRGSAHLIKLDHYVEKIVVPLTRNNVWLGYASSFEAAHLVVEEGDRIEVFPPHQNLLTAGRIGCDPATRLELRARRRAERAAAKRVVGSQLAAL